jgi:uncharacterized membrane protein
MQVFTCFSCGESKGLLALAIGALAFSSSALTTVAVSICLKWLAAVYSSPFYLGVAEACVSALGLANIASQLAIDSKPEQLLERLQGSDASSPSLATTPTARCCLLPSRI